MTEEQEMIKVDEQDNPSHSDKNNRQTEIHLANMDFFSFPREILKFKRVQVLALSRNKIEILPNEISGLSELCELYLDHNHLKCFPSSFSQLTSLSVLCIQSNQLAIFPDEICNLCNLKTLNVSDNSFTYLPKSFRDLENLNHFSIDWFTYTIPALPTCTSNTSLIKQIREACGAQIHSLTCIEFLLTLSQVDQNRTQEILTQLFEPDDGIENRNIFHKSAMNNNLGVLLAAGKYIEVCQASQPTQMNPINSMDAQLNTPLQLSLEHLSINAAEILLYNFSANPFINGKGRSSGCLFHAVRALNLKMVQFILGAATKITTTGGEHVNSKDETGNSLLHELFSSSNSKKQYIVLPIATYLVQSGGDLNAKNDEGYSVMHSAIQNGCCWAVIWAEKNFQNRINWEVKAGTFSRNLLEELAIHPKITYPLIRILIKRIDLTYLTSPSSILDFFQMPAHRKLQSISKQFLISQHIQKTKKIFISTKMQEQFEKQSSQLKRYQEMFCSRAKHSAVKRGQNKSIDIPAHQRAEQIIRIYRQHRKSNIPLGFHHQVDFFSPKIPIQQQQDELTKLRKELASLEEDPVEVRSVPPRPSRIVSLKLFVGKSKNIPCSGDVDDPLEKQKLNKKEEKQQEQINPLYQILEQALHLLFEIKKRRPISWRIMVFQLISKCLSAENQEKDQIQHFAIQILQFIVKKQEIILKYILDNNTQFNNILTQVIELALQKSKQLPYQIVKDLFTMIRQIISIKPLIGFELANLSHLKLKCQPRACMISLSPSKPQIRIIRQTNPSKVNLVTTIPQLANRQSKTSYNPQLNLSCNTPPGILFRDEINQCNIGKLPPRPAKKGIKLREINNNNFSEKKDNSNVILTLQEDQQKQQIFILKDLYSTQFSNWDISNQVLNTLGESTNK